MDDPAAIRMNTEYVQFLDNFSHNELSLLLAEKFKASLDDVIGVLVLNKLNHVTVAKFRNQKVPLICFSELKCLLDDAATVFAAG